ncbi:MAG: hypothetical protein H8D42_00235 [Candidatus Marinimicrobia bacterium]|nr:hypothetical protein [Candidatus Neomarinimicrobiota bacterium]
MITKVSHSGLFKYLDIIIIENAEKNTTVSLYKLVVLAKNKPAAEAVINPIKYLWRTRNRLGITCRTFFP